MAMARVQIEYPEKKVYTALIPVRVGDVNYGAHVGNDAILRIAQDARIIFYQSLGIKDELSLEGDTGQIIVDAAVVYKAEAFLGDTLRVEIAIDGFSKHGFDMYYRITNEASGKEVAVAKTGIVCFLYKQKKVARIPTGFLASLQQLLQGE